MTAFGSLWIVGAGGHGRVVADAARSAGWKVVGFLDDNPALDGHRVSGLPVRRLAEVAAPGSEELLIPVALGIGGNSEREQVHGRLEAFGFRVVSVLHNEAVVADTALIQAGTVVLATAVVNSDARIGRGCIINSGAVVEHDCVLGDFAHVSPNAAMGGGARLGKRSHLGLGAVVLPKIVVGSDVRVGAAAAVIRDVPDGVTVVGVPAQVPGKREGMR